MMGRSIGMRRFATTWSPAPWELWICADGLLHFFPETKDASEILLTIEMPRPGVEGALLSLGETRLFDEEVGHSFSIYRRLYDWIASEFPNGETFLARVEVIR